MRFFILMQQPNGALIEVGYRFESYEKAKEHLQWVQKKVEGGALLELFKLGTYFILEERASLSFKNVADFKEHPVKKEAAEWIDWNGGIIPVHLASLVCATFRDGTIHTRSGRQFRWNHFQPHIYGHMHDIVKYKVIQ